jgi:predicted small secreted protein
MRILIAIPAVLVLAACNVSKEGNAVTVQYDQNTAADVSNTVQNVAADIGNDVKNTSDKVSNKTGDKDDGNSQANATENK